MTQEQFLILKDEFIQDVKNHIIEHGEINPHLSVLGDIRNPKSDEDKRPALVQIPLPENLMENKKEKQHFLNFVFPSIVKDVKKKFKIQSLVWTAIDYSPKNEFVMISVQTSKNKEFFTYKIVRNGKSVNSVGNLVDKIELKTFDLKEPIDDFIKTIDLFDKGDNL